MRTKLCPMAVAAAVLVGGFIAIKPAQAMPFGDLGVESATARLDGIEKVGCWWSPYWGRMVCGGPRSGDPDHTGGPAPMAFTDRGRGVRDGVGNAGGKVEGITFAGPCEPFTAAFSAACSHCSLSKTQTQFHVSGFAETAGHLSQPAPAGWLLFSDNGTFRPRATRAGDADNVILPSDTISVSSSPR